MDPFRLRSPFSTLLEVREYQIVQRRDGELLVRIVTGQDLVERVRRAVAATLEQAGAAPPPIGVEPVDGVERDRGPAAKLKLVIAER